MNRDSLSSEGIALSSVKSKKSVMPCAVVNVQNKYWITEEQYAKLTHRCMRSLGLAEFQIESNQGSEHSSPFKKCKRHSRMNIKTEFSQFSEEDESECKKYQALSRSLRKHERHSHLWKKEMDLEKREGDQMENNFQNLAASTIICREGESFHENRDETIFNDLKFGKSFALKSINVLGKKDQLTLLDQLQNFKCKLHSNLVKSKTGKSPIYKKLGMVCIECNKVFCSDCSGSRIRSQQNHKNHKLINLDELLQKTRNILKQYKNKSEQKQIQNILKSSQVQNQNQNQNNNQIQIKQNQIKISECYRQSYVQYKQLVDLQIQNIVSKLRSQQKHLHYQLDHYFIGLSQQVDQQKRQQNIMKQYTKSVGKQIEGIIQLQKPGQMKMKAQKLIKKIMSTQNQYNMSIEGVIQKLATPQLPPQFKINIIAKSQEQFEPILKDLVKIQFGAKLVIQDQQFDENKDEQKLIQITQKESQTKQIKIQETYQIVSDTKVQGVEVKKQKNKEKVESSRLVKVKSMGKLNLFDSIEQSPTKPKNFRRLAPTGIVTKNLRVSSNYIENPDTLKMMKSSTHFIENPQSLKLRTKIVPPSPALSHGLVSLCDLNLKQEDLIAFLQKQISAKNTKQQIKTLKICNNKLTDNGFNSIFHNLDNLISLNVSNNLLTEKSLDLIIKNKEQLPRLRILNLKANKCFKSASITVKIDALRKLGIIACIE